MASLPAFYWDFLQSVWLPSHYTELYQDHDFLYFIPLEYYFPSSGISIFQFRSMFLSGYKRYLVSMFDKKRLVPAILFWVFLILTLVAAYKIEKNGLTMLFLLLQILSYFWFSITFIPFYKTIIKKTCGCFVKSLE